MISASHPIFKLFFSQILGQISMFIGALLLAYYFSEGELSEFGIFFAYISLLTPIASLRLEWALVNAVSESERDDIRLTGIYICAVFSLISTLIFYFLSYFSIPPFSGSMVSYTLYVGPSILAGSIGQLILYSGIARMDFSTVSRFNFINQCLRGLVPILIAWLLLRDPEGLAVGEVVARSLIVAFFWQKVFHGFSFLPPQNLTAIVRGVFSRQHRFILISTPSSFLDTFGALLMIFLAGFFEDARTVGAIWFLQRLFGFPLSLVGKTFGDYLHAKLGENRRTGNVHASRKLFLRSLLILIVLATLVCTISILMSLYVQNAQIFANWDLAIQLIPAYVWLPSILLVSAPLSRILLVNEWQSKKFWYDCLNIICGTLAFLISKYLGFEVFETILSVSLAQSFAAAIYIGICYCALSADIVAGKSEDRTL